MKHLTDPPQGAQENVFFDLMTTATATKVAGAS